MCWYRKRRRLLLALGILNLLFARFFAFVAVTIMVEVLVADEPF